jgi:hypothetical protein
MTPEATAGGHGDKRERTSERLVAALLSEPTYERAAKAASLSKATVLRRMRDPKFRAAYRAARRDLLEATVARLQQAATDAVITLQRALNCRTPSVRVTAARSILDYALRAAELVDLEERLEEVEQRLAGDDATRR